MKSEKSSVGCKKTNPFCALCVQGVNFYAKPITQKGVKMKYWGMFFSVLAAAGFLQAAEITAVPSVRHEQRLAAHRALGADAPSIFGTDYLHFKQDVQKEWGLSVGLDASFTAQRSAPNGKQTARSEERR